jgi:Uridine kinase
MAKDKMIEIDVRMSDGSIKHLTESMGISVGEIAEKVYKEDSRKYVCARTSGKLRELTRKLSSSCELEFITPDSVVGFDLYKRSLVLLMLSAVDSVADKKEGEYLVDIMYSLGKGFFCVINNNISGGKVKITDEIISMIRNEMDRMIEADLKIEKKSYSTEDAIAHFTSRGMVDKAELFKYRRTSKTNMYVLNGYADYFYGYMLPSTGYIKGYDLLPYADGMVLVIPDRKTLECGPYVAPEKLYSILRQSEDWGSTLGITNVGRLNSVIAQGGMNNLMLVQEALMEKQIAEIADKIKDGGKQIVLIAGPSSSGKTTFSNRLSIQLQAHGLHPHPIAMDNFFKEREETPKDENGKYDFECLEAMDLKLFNETMSGLLKGEEMDMPTFDFTVGKKVFDGNKLKIEKTDVLVVEGIHALNPESTESLPNEACYKIYISALTQLNIDEHNRISTTDTRLLRRIVRDARTRGNDAQKTISMWPSVRAGEEENIFPFQEEADAMINSALIYELSAIKQFVEPLLFSVPQDSEEFYEAKRLLKFLDYFLGIDVQMVPANSLLREFIGGGCFKV